MSGKLHPHLKKYLHDVILSETMPGANPSKWKEELIKHIQEEVIDNLDTSIDNETDLNRFVEDKLAQVKVDLEKDLESIGNTVKQIPLDLLRRYRR
jgi:hypothetical protein